MKRRVFFLVYYRADQKADYYPLLSAQEMGTSFISLVLNNHILTLENGSFFKLQTTETLLGAQMQFSSSLLKVTVDFILISEGGLKIVINLKNVSEQQLTLGMACVFDSWLGEKANLPFQTETQKIEKETVFSVNNLPIYWISAEPSSKRGLKVLVKDNSVTKPTKVVFANWKKLRENLWEFKASTQELFSPSSYSSADSAAAHYYTLEALAKGQTRQIVLVLGNSNSALTTAELESRTSQNKEQKFYLNENYLKTVQLINILNNLLDELNASIKEGKDTSLNQIELIINLLLTSKNSEKQEKTDIIKSEEKLKIVNNILANLNLFLAGGKYSKTEIESLKILLNYLNE